MPCGRAQPGSWCYSYRPYKVVLRKVTRPGPLVLEMLTVSTHSTSYLRQQSQLFHFPGPLIDHNCRDECLFPGLFCYKGLIFLRLHLGHDEVYVSVDTVSEVKSPTPRIFVLLVLIAVCRYRPKKLYQFPYPTNCVFSPYKKVLGCNTEVIIVPILHSYCED